MATPTNVSVMRLTTKIIAKFPSTPKAEPNGREVYANSDIKNETVEKIVKNRGSLVPRANIASSATSYLFAKLKFDFPAFLLSL
jgi:hypothetical protein